MLRKVIKDEDKEEEEDLDASVQQSHLLSAEAIKVSAMNLISYR